MKTISTVLFSILFLFVLPAKAQQPDKATLYSDFDELVSLIEASDVQLPFREAVTGFDQLFAIKALRDCIDTVTSNEGFFNILHIGLGYLYDGQSKECYQIPDYLENCVQINMTSLSALEKKMEWTKKNRKTFGNSILYYKGYYYLQGMYTHLLLSTDDTLFFDNPRIISYNDEPFKEFIQRSLPLFDQSGTHWDAEREEYYSTTAFIPDEGILILDSSGVKVEIDLDEPYLVQVSEGGIHTYKGIPPSSYPSTSKKVLYIKSGKILYIYLDNFIDPEKQVIRKIKEINAPIQKVVIDIRENKGGDSQMWQEILQTLISEPLSFQTQTLVKNTPLLKEKISSCPLYKEKLEQGEEIQFDVFPNESFLRISRNSLNLKPSDQSIKFQGPIYILQNENLIDEASFLPVFAKGVNQLVLVGTPTGQIISSSLPPFFFQLPHSKFTFSLNIAMDLTEDMNPSAIFQTTSEIDPELTLKDMVKSKQDLLRYEQQSLKYLDKYDLLFKKVQKIQ